MQAETKNMERMSEVVTECNDQQLQHMLTHAQWDHEAVMTQVAQDADQAIGDDQDAALVIDESSIIKKGKHSVGVARQWCGRLGKVDNCQVGVFAALGAGKHATVVDYRLYLPKEWTDNKARCKQAGIPEDVTFKSKCQLAVEMVREARNRGLRFGWVGLDGGYGKDPACLREIEALGETFMADVHSNQMIYLKDPQPMLPLPHKGPGRPGTQPRTSATPVRVDIWTREQPPEAWQRVSIRESTKGALQADFLHQRVWLWDGKELAAKCWHLVVRREIASPGEIKYSLSNAIPESSLERLAFMQGQRFWIERAFQNAKSESGMADYQARSWASWHHHMALVGMAMLFMLEERRLQEEAIPLLSCGDIEQLLKQFLPKKNINKHDVILEMERRHKRRASSIRSAYTRQSAALTQGAREM
ncbi:MAG: IS701 family transposase [Magnetococcales bacterium]|nr:IS701 family transposase [Magnetococcales bacterium]NGZ07126.1 IS701 family transposase [Magnetococcales bacterium]